MDYYVPIAVFAVFGGYLALFASHVAIRHVQWNRRLGIELQSYDRLLRVVYRVVGIVLLLFATLVLLGVVRFS